MSAKTRKKKSTKKRASSVEKSAPSTGGTKRAILLSVGAISALTIGIYANALDAPFLFDDLPGIVGNKYLRDLSNLVDVLMASSPPRPILNLTYALNYSWGQLNPSVFRATNILIHILNALILYHLIRIALEHFSPKEDRNTNHPTMAALGATLLFVSHPVHTESVTFIWGRSETLCTLFYLLSVLLFVKGGLLDETELPRKKQRARRFYIGSFLSFLLGLGSKAIAVSLPLVLLAFDFALISRGETRKLMNRVRSIHAWFLGIAFLRIVLQFGAIARAVTHPPSEDLPYFIPPPWPEGLNQYSNLLTQFKATVASLRILILPTNLNADHDFVVSTSLLDPSVIFSITVLVLLIVVAVLVYKKLPLVTLGLFWYLATLSFFMVIVLADQLVERRSYQSSTGFFILVGGIINYLLKVDWPVVSRKVVGAVGLIVFLTVVALFSAGTVKRNRVWMDEYTLWSDTAAKSPNKNRVLTNLAIACIKRDRHEEALEWAQKAVQANPREGESRVTVVSAYYNLGRYQEATEEFIEAFTVTPAHATRWYLKNFQSLRGSPVSQAIPQLEQQITNDPNSRGDHLVALGLINLETLNNKRKARQFFEEGLKRQVQGFRPRIIEEKLREAKK